MVHRFKEVPAVLGAKRVCQLKSDAGFTVGWQDQY
jgi:hypothetical protein